MGSSSGGGGNDRPTIGPKRTRAGKAPEVVDARERAISGTTTPAPTRMVASKEEKARIRAYEEINKRQESADELAKAGLLGKIATAVGTATRSKMKTELLKGGTPVTERVGGRDITVGVVGKGLMGDTAYTGRPGYDPIADRASGGASDGGAKATTTAVTPVASTGGAAETSRASRRLLAQSQKSARSRIFYS